MFDVAFMVSCLVQPMMINNTEKVGAEELILNDERGMENKRSLYRSEKVRENLRKLIPYFDELGTFD